MKKDPPKKDPPLLAVHFVLRFCRQRVFLRIGKMENIANSSETNDSSESIASTSQPPAKKRKYVRKIKVVKNITNRTSSRPSKRPQRYGKRLSTQNHDSFFLTENNTNSRSTATESDPTEAIVLPLAISTGESQSILSPVGESVDSIVSISSSECSTVSQSCERTTQSYLKEILLRLNSI